MTKTSKGTIRNRINKEIGKIGTYHDGIPVDEISVCIKNHGGMMVQEDGTEWSGIFCGEQGTCNIPVVFADYSNMFVSISWYKMDSGRYEIVTYIS